MRTASLRWQKFAAAFIYSRALEESLSFIRAAVLSLSLEGWEASS
jgi:hypothetical protein